MSQILSGCTCLIFFTFLSFLIHCIPLLTTTFLGFQEERKSSKGSVLSPILALSLGINSPMLYAMLKQSQFKTWLKTTLFCSVYEPDSYKFFVYLAAHPTSSHPPPPLWNCMWPAHVCEWRGGVGREREWGGERERERERENSELDYTRIEILGNCLFLQSVHATITVLYMPIHKIL